MKVLIVCESVHSSDSGGRVVRYLSSILNRNDNLVKLVVFSERRKDAESDFFYNKYDMVFIPRSKDIINRIANFFFNTKEIVQFREILKSFSPDVVHFASFEESKPAQIIIDAKLAGAKIVLQPWTMGFYCAQGFGYRENSRCNLCASGSYWNALWKKCITLRGLPSIVKKYKLHKSALYADLFFSSNEELDFILNEYGIKQNKIFRFPIPFDCKTSCSNNLEDKNYFIYYGQSVPHKGINVILKLFNDLPKENLKIYPLSGFKVIVLKKNIEIVNGIRWSNGLGDAIASAKAVLVPSLWSTSTEYSLCEALLYKKPVIVFNVGVHKEIFKDRFNAIVVDPNDINSLKRAVIELSDNKELRKSIGEEGYKTLLNINDPEKLYNLLMKAYSFIESN